MTGTRRSCDPHTKVNGRIVAQPHSAVIQGECDMRRFRKGLTLIELTVVLLILVALAGVLVPYLSGYIERGHGASSADNMKELVKSWELYRVKFLNSSTHQPTPGYPDRLDSLVETGGNNLFSRLDAELTANLTSTALTAVQAASLADSGITGVYDHRAAADFPAVAPFVPSATFGDEVEGHYATTLGTVRNLAAMGRVAIVSPAWVANHLNAEPAGTYVAFGVGARCAAVGKVMADAPVHFNENGQDPNGVYSRFIVVFQIPGPAAAVGFKARFAGVLSSHGCGLGEHLGEYYQAN